jgi:hypothetical protein
MAGICSTSRRRIRTPVGSTGATATLKQAKDAAPVWFRHQALARSFVADLAERQTRLTPTLRELVGSLEAR